MEAVDEWLLDSEEALERKPRKSTMETDAEIRSGFMEAKESSIKEIYGTKPSVYFDEVEGSAASTDSFMVGKMREKAEADTAFKSLRNESNSSLSISLSSGGYEETETTRPRPILDRVEAHEQNGVVHESKLELGKMDVERVLEEQQTHDLYCPNCRSCITKRVILRKRKRSVHDSPYAEKPEIQEEPYFLDVAHPTDLPDVEEPKIFKCLQCFEFFIVTGSSLNCLSLFTEWWKGKMSGTGIPPMPAESHSVNSVTGYQTAATEPVKPVSSLSINPVAGIPPMPAESLSVNSVTGYQTAATEPVKPVSSLSINPVAGLPLASTAEPVKPATSPSFSSLAGIPPMPAESLSVNSVTGYQTAATEPVKPVSSLSINPVAGLPLASTAEPVKPATSPSFNSLAGLPSASALEPVKPTILTPSPLAGIPKIPVTSVHVTPVTVQTGLTSASVAEPVEPVTSQSVSPLAGIPSTLTTSTHVTGVTGIPTTLTTSAHVTGVTGIPTTLTTSAHVTGVTGPPLISGTDLVNPVTCIPMGPLPGENAGIVDEQASRYWEVLKSIVYGGLAESIASLGVVSSAAGGAADTVNIVALGLANLICGLFMIAHNLWEMRIEGQVEGGTPDQKDKIKRYEETLGNVRNFWLHAMVVVLAYLVFGVLPPITYGFSFRKSDNKDYKLIAVAVASLLCTALLAVGKARIQKGSMSDYLKVVLYYVSLGVAASGLSYATGHLVKELLVKLGFTSSSAATPTSSLDFGFLGTDRLLTSSWASY